MARPIDPDKAINGQTVLQDCVIDTIDPDTKSRRLIWSVQLLEGRVADLGIVLRAHAQQIASSVVMPDGSVAYFHNKGQYYADLNAVELSIDPGSSTKARLAPRYDIMMNPRGSGLGRVLMSLIIRRAKERFADCAIGNARLGPADAMTNQERDRRNKFYEEHLFTYDFPDDPERRVGHVSAKRIGDLQERVNLDKVIIVPSADLFRQYADEYSKAKHSATLAGSLQKSIEAQNVAWMSRLRFERRVWGAAVLCLAAYAVALHLSR